ncbi:hypothetical protein AGMMS50230_10050 [Spirochaetia bacterium]|nr:hypothetical protein AGMMS50230_10050 [Spirochaetia bacterium]
MGFITLKNERLLADLKDLEQSHEIKRKETAKALEDLETARNSAFLQLKKTEELFKYLTWKQQETINSRFLTGSPTLEEIRRHSITRFPAASYTFPVLEKTAVVPGPARALGRIHTIRKNSVTFGLIQKRAEELSGAIGKALTAFEYQYKSACRALFPFGVFSRLRRKIRRLLGRSYFSWQDMSRLRDLGMAAGFVFKMAEAPVF